MLGCDVGPLNSACGGKCGHGICCCQPARIGSDSRSHCTPTSTGMLTCTLASRVAGFGLSSIQAFLDGSAACAMATGATGTGWLVLSGSSANFGTADPIATDATLVKPGFAALAAAAAATAALAGLVAAAFGVGFGVSTEEASKSSS